MKKLHLAIIAAAAALIMAACGTKKSAVPATVDTASTEVTATSTPAQRYAAMTAAYGLWHDVQMPVRATLRSPMSLSASGRLTMVRDSLVHMSLRVLGMEVAVVRATRDSVMVVDKFHRYVLSVGMDALTARTGMTLLDVQCALLGRAFTPGNGDATPRMASMFSLSEQGGELHIAPAREPQAFSWSMTAATLSDGRVALTGLEVQPRGHSAATCAYTPAASLTAAGAVASALDMNATVAKKKLSARLQYTLGEARWNGFAAPAAPSLRGYTRITPAQLPQMLKL